MTVNTWFTLYAETGGGGGVLPVSLGDWRVRCFILADLGHFFPPSPMYFCFLVNDNIFQNKKEGEILYLAISIAKLMAAEGVIEPFSLRC